MVVVLDPGHGGKDPGAVGPSGLTEKKVNLAVAEQTARWLSDLADDQVIVRLTREDDRAVGLQERVNIANRAGAACFISIHCNSATVPAHGTETFIAENTRVSYPLAEALQENLLREFSENTDRGIKRRNFKVLRSTKMAAALVELQFIHVPCGEDQLRNEKNQERFGLALAQGIMAFLGLEADVVPEPLSNSRARSSFVEPDEPEACPCLTYADMVAHYGARLKELSETMKGGQD